MSGNAESSGRSLVSVVIPTRDRHRRLSLALRSALAQREVNLEVIVVDDGSRDGTSQAIRRLADPRIRLVRHESPLGESAARNRGIAEAAGTWIAFLDDDDVWAPDKLRRQLQAMADAGRNWAYAGHVTIDDRFRILTGSPPLPPERVMESLSRYNAVPGSASNVIATAELLALVGPFDAGLKRTPDWDMWLRLARAGAPAWVCAPLVAICVHAGNMSRDMSVMFRELKTLADRYGIAVDWARHYRWAAWTALQEGRRWRATRYYAGALAEGDVLSAGRAAVAMLRGSSACVSRARHTDAWTPEARSWLDELA